MCNKSRIAKPMTTSDYERVEQELNQHISPSSLNNFVSKSLQNAAGWSSAGGLGKCDSCLSRPWLEEWFMDFVIIEDESDDDFHPVAGHVDNSLTSSVSNSVSSSCHSTSSSYHLSRWDSVFISTIFVWFRGVNNFFLFHFSKASEQYSFPSQSSSHYQQGRLKEKSKNFYLYFIRTIIYISITGC